MNISTFRFGLVSDSNSDGGNIQRSATDEQMSSVTIANEKAFFQSPNVGTLNNKQSQVAADIVQTIVTASPANQSNQVFLGC